MFKSLTIYQLTQATDAVLKRLPAALESLPFAECTDHQAKARGFVPPLGSGEITYGANGGTLFRLRTDVKELPAGAIKLMVQEQIADRAGDDSFDPDNKTDVRLLKDEITQKLLPGCVAAPSWTYAYIDRPLGMMFVGASELGADEFVEAFKAAFKALPLTLLGIEREPCDIFTEWLKAPDTLGDTFQLGHDCSLKHAKEGGTAVINIKQDDLDSDEMGAMLEAGKQCCRISLEHKDMSFAITARLGLRAIHLSDEAAADIDAEDITASEFAVFVDCLRGVLTDLEPLLGGWPKQEVLDLEDSEEAAA